MIRFNEDGSIEVRSNEQVGDVWYEVFFEFDDPEDAVFASRRAAHLAAAPRVVDENDSDFSPAKVEQPWEEKFPRVGIILFHAAHERREVIDDQNLLAGVDAELRDCLLHFRQSQVEHEPREREEDLVID